MCDCVALARADRDDEPRSSSSRPYAATRCGQTDGRPLSGPHRRVATPHRLIPRADHAKEKVGDVAFAVEAPRESDCAGAVRGGEFSGKLVSFIAGRLCALTISLGMS